MIYAIRIVITLLGIGTFAANTIGEPSPQIVTEDPVRPPAIEASGVPIVPPGLIERLQQYQNFRAASFAGWHPQGEGVIIRTRFGDTSQLHRVGVPGGFREQVTFFDEPVRGSYLPKATDGAMLLTMSVGGNENNQIYRFAIDGAKTTLLTDGESRNSWHAVNDDGTRLIFSSNKRNGRDNDLYIVDPRANLPRLLMSVENEYWYAQDFSPNGKYLLLEKSVSVNESYPALLHFETGERRMLPLPTRPVDADQPVAFGDMIFANDNRTVYLTHDAHGEFLQLARLDAVTGEYSVLTDDIPWNIGSIEIHRETETIAFTVNEGGSSSLYVMKNDGLREKLDLPLGVIRGIEFSPNGKQIGFSFSRPDRPSDVYSIRLEDGKLTQWTFSETGGLDASTFVTPQKIEFKSFDDRMIPAFIYKPRDASADNKVPVLINIHGGPESQYRPYLSSSDQFYVNEMGFAVIRPNVRGSTGYGKTYAKLDNAEKREDSVKDIGALLDWIADQDDLDASRIAVRGGSYGGYMVLASLTHYPDRLKAGIDVVGIANFQTFLKNTADYRRDRRRVEYGDERDPAMAKVFERINPTANAHKIRSALLVIHGVNDPRVPFSEAQQISEIVRGNGREVWTVFANNEGHGFGKKPNRDYQFAVEVLFLQKNLSD